MAVQICHVFAFALSPQCKENAGDLMYSPGHFYLYGVSKYLLRTNDISVLL